MTFDKPPSYDYATQDGKAGPPPSPIKGQPQFNTYDTHQHQVPPSVHAMQAGPSFTPRQDPTPVHHYMNPLTGAHIVSVLPPNHPEMVCLQEGRHIRRTKFGLLGVLAAIFWFPLGIGLCLLDRRVRCERCGEILEDGLMCG